MSSENEFAYINQTYGLNCKRGGRVTYTGGSTPKSGTIVGVSGCHIRVVMDDNGIDLPYHPTWKMEHASATRAVGRGE